MNLEEQLLRDQADGIYYQGNFRGAASLFGQICELARHREAYDVAYENGINEAICYKRAGVPFNALKRLLELESWRAPFKKYQFMVKQMCFELLKQIRPDLAQLERRLDELKSLAAEIGTACTTDFRFSEYCLLRSQGKRLEALEAIELAWAENERENINCNHSTVSGAFEANLSLGRREQAERWVDVMEGDAETECFGYRCDLAECKTRLALFDGTPRESVDFARVQLQVIKGFEEVSRTVDAIVCTVRANLLLGNGDPLKKVSKLIRSFRGFYYRNRSLENEFDVRLVLADVRLASVRWAVGMQPAEDFYYTNPQSIVFRPRVAREDLANRVRQAKLSIDRAAKLASHLDGAFCCDWRQLVIVQRKRRLFDIIQNKI